MSKKSKMSIILLMVILVASILYAGFITFEKQKTDQANAVLKTELEQSQDREKQKILQVQKLEVDLKKQVEKAKDERELLTKKVKSAESKVANLKSDVTEAEQDRDKWKNSISTVRADRDKLSSKVDALKGQLDEAKESAEKAIFALTKAQEAVQQAEEKAAAAANIVQPALNQMVISSQSKGPTIIKTPVAEQQQVQVAPVKVEPPENETYWAQVLREKTELEIDLRKLKNELSKQSIEIVDLEQTNVDLQISLENFEKKKAKIEESLTGKHSALNKELRYKEDMINSLSLEVAKARSDRSKFENNIESVEKENSDLRGQVKGLVSTKSALEKTIVRLKDDKNKVEHMLGVKEALVETKIREIWEIKNRLDKSLSYVRDNLDESFSSVKDNLESSFKNVETDLKSSIHSVQNNLDQSFVDVKTNIDHSFDSVKKYSTPKVELPPIVVNSRVKEDSKPPQDQAPGLDGKVISINVPNNFLIMNVGEGNNIRIGDTYSVYRGATYIGSVEIIQVRKEISAADIKEQRSPIKVGDIVR